MGKAGYRYPRAFIKGLAGNHSLRRSNQCFEITRGEGICGEVVYEEALREALDMENSRLRRNLCIVTPRGEVLIAPEGTPVHLQELQGIRIALLVEEGSIIGEKKPIARILTGKGEVRLIKARENGLILYAGCLPQSRPEKCIVVMVDERGVERGVLC